ncbi:energy transducer TonB [Burkholderiaceae bacterium UC74_6]
MSRLIHVFLLPLLAFAACATQPPRLPVAPEPGFTPLTEACRALGASEFHKNSVQRPPYGWTLIRMDVENGAPTRIEILDSSPKGAFDAAAKAKYEVAYFPSGKSAQGCIVSHRWD